MIERSVRNLLLALGVGRNVAAMVTPNMYQSPAVTDPKSPHAMVVVGYLQDALNKLGYSLMRTGYLDQPTGQAMHEVVGDGWERMTWADNIAAVLSAVRAPGITAGNRTPALIQNVTLSGVGDGGDGLGSIPFGLPDVPGGLATYALGGYLLYRYLKKKH